MPEIRNWIRSSEEDVYKRQEEDLIDLGRMVYEYFEAGNLVGSEAEGLCEAIRSRKQSIEAVSYTHLDVYKRQISA